jgi:hypothetical protein
MKLGKRWTAAAILIGALGAGQALALVRDSVDAAKTVKGDLETWRYVERPGDHPEQTNAEVTMNGVVLMREEKVLGIRVEWEHPSTKQGPAERVLLAVEQPSPSLCESLYRLVDLSKPKSPHVTARFGNCHGEPIVHVKGDELTFYFARFNNKPEAAYRYSSASGLKKVPVLATMRSPTK